MNIDKPCYNSSCEPSATVRRSKKLTEYHRCTRSLWHGFFWHLLFDANRFQTDLQAWPLAAAEIEIIMWYAIVLYAYIVLRKASVAHLQNPSKIPIVLLRYNQNQNGNQNINQNENQKTNPWRDSVKIRDTPWVFFDLSSVAAGSQSATQQVYLNEELRNNVRQPWWQVWGQIFCPHTCPHPVNSWISVS